MDETKRALETICNLVKDIHDERAASRALEVRISILEMEIEKLKEETFSIAKDKDKCQK